MVLDVIKNRRSVRSYKPDDIPDELINEIIMAGQFAPTANNLRGIEYIVIRDQEIKKEIYDIASPKQDFVKAAPVLIIPVINTKKSAIPMADLSLASENLFLQATAMGIGSVWKNFYPPVAEGVKAILGIPTEYTLINAIPIGYPRSQPTPHQESQFEADRIHRETF